LEKKSKQAKSLKELRAKAAAQNLKKDGLGSELEVESGKGME